jgi:hypothetical protein
VTATPAVLRWLRRLFRVGRTPRFEVRIRGVQRTRLVRDRDEWAAMPWAASMPAWDDSDWIVIENSYDDGITWKTIAGYPVTWNTPGRLRDRPAVDATGWPARDEPAA